MFVRFWGQITNLGDRRGLRACISPVFNWSFSVTRQNFTTRKIDKIKTFDDVFSCFDKYDTGTDRIIHCVSKKVHPYDAHDNYVK